MERCVRRFVLLASPVILEYTLPYQIGKGKEAMLIYEYKVDGNQQQYIAIDEAIRIVQFIRNKCLRKWMDGRGVCKNDLQCYCAVLAKDYSFASRLNSQACIVFRLWHLLVYLRSSQNKPPSEKTSEQAR
jgi:putative transposase